jgi:hypothetical protein
VEALRRLFESYTPENADAAKAVESFLAYVDGELAKDPIIGVNFATGELLRKSGRVFDRIQIQSTVPGGLSPMPIGLRTNDQPTAWPFATPIAAKPQV